MPFCEVHYRPYPETHAGCVLCYQSKAKKSTVDARTQAKQEKDKQKAKDTSKGSKTAIKPVSKKQAGINAELAKIKKELLSENPTCFSSGETSNLTLSHIIPRTCKAFATYKPNLVLEHLEVHQIFEHNKKLYKELYPFAWQCKLERVKRMCNTEYEKLKAKGEQD